MSNPMDKSNCDLAQLNFRAQNLRHVVSQKLNTARKKNRNLLILGVALVIVSLATLGNITRLTFALDAEALTEIGRAELERSFPAGRQSMQTYLEAEAPRVAQGVVSSIASSIPGLRPLVLEQIAQHLPAMTNEFEQRLVDQMRETLVASKAQIDEEMPNAGDTERVVRLVEVVTTQFQQNFQDTIQTLHPEYSSQVDRVVVYLDSLRNKPDAALTPKERTHKEIIETILRLSVQAHEHQKDGGYDF